MKIVCLICAAHSGPTPADQNVDIDPGSAIALDAAVGLALQTETECTVMAAGTAEQDHALCLALGRGASQAFRVTEPSIREGGLRSLAAVLSSAMKRIGFDVVIVGSQSIEWGTGATAPAVAHFLGVTHVTQCTNLRAGGDGNGHLLADHVADDVMIPVRIRLPAVISIVNTSLQAVVPPVHVALSAPKDITIIEAADMTVPFRPYRVDDGRDIVERTTDASQQLGSVSEALQILAAHERRQ